MKHLRLPKRPPHLNSNQDEIRGMVIAGIIVLVIIYALSYIPA